MMKKPICYLFVPILIGLIRQWQSRNIKQEDIEKKDSVTSEKNARQLIGSKNASPYGRTSGVEGYHSVVNHFAPKMYNFSFKAMRSRLLLAAMHYNENNGKNQQQNKQRELQYAITFLKYKKGGYIARRILRKGIYIYVETLFERLVEKLQQPRITDNDEEANLLPLCSNFSRPDKTMAVKEHTTRRHRFWFYYWYINR